MRNDKVSSKFIHLQTPEVHKCGLKEIDKEIALREKSIIFHEQLLPENAHYLAIAISDIKQLKLYKRYRKQVMKLYQEHIKETRCHS